MLNIKIVKSLSSKEEMDRNATSHHYNLTSFWEFQSIPTIGVLQQCCYNFGDKDRYAKEGGESERKHLSLR